MAYELRSISPERLARISAWVMFAFFLLISLFAAPMFLLAPIPDAPGQPPKFFFVVMILLYPLFGALWGWISGQVWARIYNFAAKKIGGITFEAVRLDATP